VTELQKAAPGVDDAAERANRSDTGRTRLA
jgi:hypothetical protein